jgi:hypothetical protein
MIMTIGAEDKPPFLEMTLSEYMTLEEAGATLPRPKSREALEYWARRGLVGGTVKLETVKIGGTVCVSTASLEEFFKRLTTATTARKSARAAARGA